MHKALHQRDNIDRNVIIKEGFSQLLRIAWMEQHKDSKNILKLDDREVENNRKWQQ